MVWVAGFGFRGRDAIPCRNKKVARLVAVREEAFRLILGAAEAGMAVAQAEMGHIWRDGRWGIVSPNATAAAGWYSVSARNGFPPAQLELAYALIGGVGVAKDEVKACGWLEHASRAGIAEARYELGARHMRIFPRAQSASDQAAGVDGKGAEGDGVAPEIKWDVALGEKLLSSAASGGHSGAMLMLGRWYLGRTKRRELGLGWLRRAAEAGVGEAQMEYGVGVLEGADAKNKAAAEEGMRFLKEAVKNGVAGATESMKLWTKTLGMLPKAPGGDGATFVGAHLLSDHELHREVGRLKIKVMLSFGFFLGVFGFGGFGFFFFLTWVGSRSRRDLGFRVFGFWGLGVMAFGFKILGFGRGEAQVQVESNTKWHAP